MTWRFEIAGVNTVLVKRNNNHRRAAVEAEIGVGENVTRRLIYADWGSVCVFPMRCSNTRVSKRALYGSDQKCKVKS